MGRPRRLIPPRPARPVRYSDPCCCGFLVVIDALREASVLKLQSCTESVTVYGVENGAGADAKLPIAVPGRITALRSKSTFPASLTTPGPIRHWTLVLRRARAGPPAVDRAPASWGESPYPRSPAHEEAFHVL